ncbi:FAD-binding domain-containing protein [Mycena olivaceomarginata]|nr:FAD-binding domain-containing protein [Mycena olivaceomarginata]
MLSRISLLVSILVVSSLAKPAARTCKCTAGQPCWPSAKDWATFSNTLSHPIFDVHPPGYYCHVPHFNAALCSSIQTNCGNSIWRSDQPGAEQSDNWEFTPFSQCSILGNRTDACGQGRVPAIAVNATTVNDTTSFGRGLGPGSLMIWTHHFTAFNFAKNFKYKTGQSAGVPAITVGPGNQWVDTYAFAAKNKVVVAGGVAALGSDGAGGGWALGGGHNIISPHLGLGADNVLELDLVLPNGTFITASPTSHPDLFWAARGGGGPSFGVSTRLVYKAHPITPLYASFFEALAATPDAFVQLLDTYHAALPALADAGWSGYYPFENASYFALMYLLPNGNTTYGNATLGTFIQAARAIPGVTIKTDATTTYPDYQSWFVANVLDPVNVVGFNYTGGVASGLGGDTASWLLPRELFEDPESAHIMSKALLSVPAGIGQHVGGGIVSANPPTFNAMHPIWRTSLSDLSFFGAWNDSAPQSTIQTIRQQVSNLVKPFRDLTPSGGQYLNEPDIFVPDYTAANWGTNYPRLLEIKKAVDPTNQLLVAQGVGAVGWDDEQICKTS